MLKFMKEQKTHIVYIVVILVILALGYTLLVPKPAEVIKTVSKAQIQNNNIVTTRKQQIDRTTVKKDKDGDITTVVEHIVDSDVSIDKSKSKSTFESKTQIIYKPRYTLGSYYTIPIDTFKIPTIFEPNNLTILGGVRLFNLPVFVNIGTNGNFNQAIIGFTLEL